MLHLLFSKSLLIFLPLTAVPSKPGPVKFSNILGDSVTLNWSPPKKDGGAPVTSYDIEISDDGKTWKKFATVDGKDTQYCAKDLEEGTACYFRIAAVNLTGSGETLTSDAVTPKKPIGTFY